MLIKYILSSMKPIDNRFVYIHSDDIKRIEMSEIMPEVNGNKYAHIYVTDKDGNRFIIYSGEAKIIPMIMQEFDMALSNNMPLFNVNDCAVKIIENLESEEK